MSSTSKVLLDRSRKQIKTILTSFNYWPIELIPIISDYYSCYFPQLICMSSSSSSHYSYTDDSDNDEGLKAAPHGHGRIWIASLQPIAIDYIDRPSSSSTSSSSSSSSSSPPTAQPSEPSHRAALSTTTINPSILNVSPDINLEWFPLPHFPLARILYTAIINDHIFGM
jgi:hypothetical protein